MENGNKPSDEIQTRPSPDAPPSPAPRKIQRFLFFFYLGLCFLFLMDFFVKKHPHFQWEMWPGFYAVFGFVACVFLVLAAKYVLRPLVKRREDYYD